MAPEIRTVPLWRQRPFQIAAGVALLVVAGVVAVVLLTRGSHSELGTPEATAPTGKASTTTTVAPPIAPLTGLPDASGVVLQRPALAVKVDNVALARRPPQAGIDVADVVYEEPVESATRLLALFQSTTPERVGPVRSTRFIDPGIVWPIGGLYVYSGGTPPKVAAIEHAPVKTLDETALAGIDARVRDGSFPAPHNLFVLPEKVWAATDDHTPPAPLFLYLASGKEFAGDPVASVDIPNYSKARYTWDAATSRWLREELTGRSSGPEPHLAESGQQVAPANLIVQRIAGTEDQSVMVGEGDAWVFSQGRAVRGRWIRPTLEDRTSFVDASGREVELTPGTTWVHLITSGEPAVTAP